jgi:hypothetical protein
MWQTLLDHGAPNFGSTVAKHSLPFVSPAVTCVHREARYSYRPVSYVLVQVLVRACRGEFPQRLDTLQNLENVALRLPATCTRILQHVQWHWGDAGYRACGMLFPTLQCISTMGHDENRLVSPDDKSYLDPLERNKDATGSSFE